MFAPRKLAYSLAVLLLFVVGIFGFIKLLPLEKASQQTASLTTQTGLKQNVADLNTKITELAKNLSANSLKNPQTVKEVTDEVQKIKQLQAKTLADVTGTPDEKNLNDALVSANNTLAPLVQNEINDLEKTTLTEDQSGTLKDAETLYSQGKYTDALVKILLINK